MKTQTFQKLPVTIAVLTTLALAAGNVVAQDATASATASAAQPTAVTQSSPQLSYGVSEILRLSQAKVGDSVIINYVQSSGNNYGLNADQIIYLRQQGVSDAVVNTMLNQRSQSVQTPTTPTTAAPENPGANTAQAPTPTTQPPVAYVPATTASAVYVVPDSQTYNYNAWLYSRPYYPYYPYYGYYPYSYGWPAISLSFGFGGYYGGYGGYHYHGGSYGGWHGGHGGGWHH